ncbi:MAG: DNA-formamidopyrimidine glycosylase family protein [Planctomycetota bacterium]
MAADMPEGDTLFRIARQLRPVLTGRTIIESRAWRPRGGPAIDADSLVGRTVSGVEAVGKHLLIPFDDGRVVHSHLGMTGAWHVYREGDSWRKPERAAALVLTTTDHTVVNFSPKQLELVTERALKRDAHLRRLGPDLMLPDVDLAEVRQRLRTHNRTPIGEAVMNQTIAAGIGNVYKSESLFFAKLNPWDAVGMFDDDRLLAYLRQTHALMRRNRGGGMRTTRHSGGPRLWVYGRSGEACLVCGEVIQMRRQGDQGRSTYWCPLCQPALSAVPRSVSDANIKRKPPIKGGG